MASGITINKEKIEGLKETIRNLYLADDIPWVIGYSGGKDSTATLQLTWLALWELPPEKLTKVVQERRKAPIVLKPWRIMRKSV